MTPNRLHCLFCLAGLSEAYNIPFAGNASQEFVRFLRDNDDAVKRHTTNLYAKAISVVQSSGTGKSRMLTEVRVNSYLMFRYRHTIDHYLHQAGKKVFTLPICLRKPEDPGYPLGDEEVQKYFLGLPKTNNLSFTSHVGIACFLATSYASMLRRLKQVREAGHDGPALLAWWHQVMEHDRGYRGGFFRDVVKEAQSVKFCVNSMSA